MRGIKIIAFTILTIVSCSAFAQRRGQKDSIYVPGHIAKIAIRHIVIEGNKRTKEFVILRQLPFKEGDSLSLPEITYYIEESRNNLINLSLFTEVEITLANWEGLVTDINIKVKERWYTFPALAFDIYDRNFNTWWVTHDHDLTRVQYGGRFSQQNVGGRNETFTATALLGYAERFDIGYTFPFIDKRLTKGLKLSAYFARQRSILYQDYFNRDVYYTDSTKFIRRSYGGQIDFTLRPKIHFHQTFTLGFNYVDINDTLYKLNPFYLQNGQEEHYLFLNYSAIYDNRDWKAYPLKGSYTEFTVNQVGLGLLSNTTVTNLYFKYQKYVPLYEDKLFFASIFNFKYSFPVNQPYYNQRGLGYGDAYISGYEYYVVDGEGYGIAKFQLRYKLLHFHLPVLYLLNKSKASVPFYIVPKIYFDTGYEVDNTGRTESPLANSLLYGYGAGLDVATGYDLAFRFEYSINRDGEKGLYLHFSGLF